MNLKQVKFSLAVVINLLAALTFGYFCFLGANFYFLGDTGTSISLAVFITLLLIGTSLGAKLLKETHGNFKSRFIWEIILLVLFTVLIGWFTYLPFSHYFTVSENKTIIKAELTSHVTEAEKMYVSYENYVIDRKNTYKSNLQTAIITMNASDADFNKYGFKLISLPNSLPYPIQIQKKLLKFQNDLLPAYYLNMKNVNSTWLTNSKSDIENWKTIGIVDVLNNIDTYSNKWKSDLITISKKRETGEEKDQINDFPYVLEFKQVKKHFTTTENPTPLSVVYSILIYVLMLLAWIFTKRHSKWPGLKVLFGFGKSAENEF